MKKLILLPFGLLISMLFISQSASAFIDVDIGTSVSYTAPKNETLIENNDESKIKDDTESASVYFIRGKVSLLLFKIGAGILKGNETHKLGESGNPFKYKFDTTVYELLFGLPIPIVDVGLILGAGSKDYTFDKSASGSKAATKSFTVLEYGLFVAIPIDITGPLALRVGGSYQAITGSEQKVDISDAVGSKAEHKVDPSASLIALTIGLEF